MSGLAAIWQFDGRPDTRSGCERMLAAQQTYGLHAVGEWSNGPVALGRRLMRLLPEDEFDRQPLVGAGGSIVLVADLRLDNRGEVVRALDISLARARALSDADILLAALERWDEACLERLVGDYAFIRWDSVRQQLLLARDPLGQRPLHYHRGNRFFAAASMPKGLHAVPEVPYAPDEERIAEWLALLPDSGANSFFFGVEQVEPGHVVSVTRTSFLTRRFWLPRRATITLRGPQEYAEALREHLDEAVRCRLRGAHDVAAHLSSGLDSSAVSATAARLLAPSGGRVVAFTAVPREGYDRPNPPGCIIDEAPLAAATAALYPNMEHVLIRSPGKSPLDDLDRDFLLFEQPMRNICNFVWLNSINDATRRRNLGVLLVGDMGNVGLSYDGLQLLPELFRQGRWIKWSHEARAMVARHGWRWRGIAARTLGPWLPGAVWIWLNRVGSREDMDVRNYSAILPHRLAKLDLSARMRRRGDDPARRPPKEAFSLPLRIDDYGNLNKGMLGGWQIDRRDPTADLRLLEFCFAVPTEQFLRDGVTKALARLALSDRLPQVVLEEPRRGLQAADWHERLMAVQDRVALELDRIAACPAAVQMLDLERLRTLVENWPSHGWERDEVAINYRVVLLRAISAGHFLRRVSGKTAEEQESSRAAGKTVSTEPTPKANPGR
jgi:asparagine synthase (glutamine-hydrolysing)